jgi:hypothetical protein
MEYTSLKQFLVRFEGRKLDATLDGRRRRVGFYASRRVAALDEESLDPGGAIDAVIAELRAQGVEMKPESRVRIVGVGYFEERHAAATSGFAFFPEGSWLRRLLARLWPRRDSR